MLNSQRFNFTESLDAFGIPDALPLLPLSLTYRGLSIQALGLLDTGASVNVLPYSVGIELGAVWEEQTNSVFLGGNLATVEARGLLVSGTIGNFKPVRLVFAWAKTDAVPLLLGRMNFFLEFNVCFYRSQLVFDVSPKP
jgi:hypothetical protein